MKDGSMVSKLNWICVKLLSFAEINTSTLVNLDGIEMMQLNDGAVQVAKESDIADVMQRLPNYYKSLKAVKILKLLCKARLQSTDSGWGVSVTAPKDGQDSLQIVSA